jgi:hypothetical protein
VELTKLKNYQQTKQTKGMLPLVKKYLEKQKDDMNNKPTSITANLNPKLISELPRMFDNQDVIKELIQNSLRAESTAIHIELSETKLSIQDNGRGCANPEHLFSAGNSGWDSNKVLEAAGIGLFSLASFEISSLKIQSHDWCLETSRENLLLKKPIVIQEHEFKSGFYVEVQLNNPLGMTAFTISKIAKWLPVPIFVNGKQEEQIRWQEHAQELPIGKFAVMPNFYSQKTVIWQNQIINSHNVTNLLDKTALECKYPNLALEILKSKWFVWDINPNSGVRPILPARHDVRDDVYLKRAIKTIINTLVETEHAKSFMELSKVSSHLICDSTNTESLLKYALLQDLGWHKIPKTSFADAEIILNAEDGYNLEFTPRYELDQNALPVPNLESAYILNYLHEIGFYPNQSYVDDKANGINIEYEEIEAQNPELYSMVKLVSSLSVNGHGMYFMVDTEEATFYFQGNLEQLAVFFQNSQATKHIVAMLINNHLETCGEFLDMYYDENAQVIDTNGAVFDLMADATKRYGTQESIEQLTAISRERNQAQAFADIKNILNSLPKTETIEKILQLVA